MKIRKGSVTFAGLGLDKRGIRKLKKKVAAIREKDKDLEKAALQAFTNEATSGNLCADLDWSTFLLFEESLQHQIRTKVIDEERKFTPYRDQGRRLKMIRTEIYMSQAEFAQKLFKPLEDEPFVGQEMKVSRSTIRDIEYGSRKITNELATLIYSRLNTSREWLLHGRGTRATETDTLTVDRIISVEHRVMNLERVVDNNIGLTLMKKAQVSEVPRVSNFELREDLSRVQNWSDDLKENFQDVRDLIRSYKDKLDLFERRLADALEELSGTTKELQQARDDLRALEQKKVETIVSDYQHSEAEDRIAEISMDHAREDRDQEKYEHMHSDARGGENRK